MSGSPRHAGQAALELLALVPAVVLLGLLAWQLAAAAHAWTVAGGAARAAARAAEVAAPARRAALEALPRGWAARARVDQGPGRVRVRVPVPAVVPGLPPPGRVEREARPVGPLPAGRGAP